MPDYVGISLNMPEYARICMNMPKSAWIAFVSHVLILISCLLECEITYFN